MSEILYIIVIITSLGFGHLLQRWFIKLKKFDTINSRSVHRSKATKTGGISIFLTLFIFSCFFYLKGENIFNFSLLIPLGIMFITGVYDDFYNADFKLKFFLQIIVAKILIDQGLIIDNFYGVFGFNEISRLAGQLFTVFVFLIIVNAINFIDGIDGMAITEFLKVILCVEILSAQPTPFFYLGIICLLSVLPLYYYNFKREYKVFLGDAGSLFLGTLIAVYIFYVLGPNYTIKGGLNINKALLSVVLIIYPLLDLLRVFIIRLGKNKSPFSADQNHLHHLLLNRGFPHYAIVLCMLTISLLFLFILLRI